MKVTIFSAYYGRRKIKTYVASIHQFLIFIYFYGLTQELAIYQEHVLRGIQNKNHRLGPQKKKQKTNVISLKYVTGMV